MRNKLLMIYLMSLVLPKVSFAQVNFHIQTDYASDARIKAAQKEVRKVFRNILNQVEEQNTDQFLTCPEMLQRGNSHFRFVSICYNQNTEKKVGKVIANLVSVIGSEYKLVYKVNRKGRNVIKLPRNLGAE